MTLDNPSNWSEVFKGSFYMAQFGLYKGQIEPVWTPLLNHHTIRVHASSSEAKPSWRYAGELSPIVGTIEEMEGTRSSIYLNRWSLFFLPQIVVDYRLKFEPARWHKEIQIIVEAYTV